MHAPDKKFCPVNSGQPVTHNFAPLQLCLLNALYIPKNALSAILILFPNRTKFSSQLISYTRCPIKKFYDFIQLEFSLYFSQTLVTYPEKSIPCNQRDLFQANLYININLYRTSSLELHTA
jgi:hypothetical protein